MPQDTKPAEAIMQQVRSDAGGWVRSTGLPVHHFTAPGHRQ